MHPRGHQYQVSHQFLTTPTYLSVRMIPGLQLSLTILNPRLALITLVFLNELLTPVLPHKYNPLTPVLPLGPMTLDSPLTPMIPLSPQAAPLVPSITALHFTSNTPALLIGPLHANPRPPQREQNPPVMPHHGW